MNLSHDYAGSKQASYEIIKMHIFAIQVYPKPHTNKYETEFVAVRLTTRSDVEATLLTEVRNV
jgi:hypothetical protein